MPTYIREAELTYRRKAMPDGTEPTATTLRSSADVARIARALIGSRLTESLLVLALDAKNKVLGFHEVARGSTSACPVLPADVLRYPLIAGATGVVLVHNHPSGDVTPSPEDRAVTRRIVDASTLLGLRMLDHLIVSDERHYSFLRVPRDRDHQDRRIVITQIAAT
jgi:DNA repair protein RadC